MADSTAVIEIAYDDSQYHSLVEVAGEFSSWSKLPLHPTTAASASATAYSAKIEGLVPGNTYMYKFIVDGEWLLASDGRPMSKF